MSDDGEGAVQATTERFTAFLRERGVELGSDVEGVTDGITVIRLATERCMLDVMKSTSTEAAYQASLVQARDRQLEHLWLRDRLDTPWALLVDQEFSGPPVSVAQFENYASRAGDRILESYRLQVEFEGLVFELMKMAAEAGYSPAGDDYLHLVRIASIIKLMEELPYFTSKARVESRQQVEEEIAAMADPDHPFWWALLDLYFPEERSDE